MGLELGNIEADEDLSAEGKQRRAQEILDRYNPQISESYSTARQQVESSAQTNFLFSLPAPDKSSYAQLKVSDATEELTVQGRANAIAAKISGSSLQEKTKAHATNPNAKGIRNRGSHTLDALKAEFDGAMEDGGLEGRIRALAIYRVCEGMGIELERVVGHHRTERHMNALADAERLDRALPTIPSGKRPAKNPFAGNRRRGAKGVGTYSSGNKTIGGGSSEARPQLFPKRTRKPSWK
jgi:hypothetical protein